MRVVFGRGQSVSDESLHLLKWDFTVNPPFSYLTEPIIGHVSGNLTWCIYLPIHRRESSITSLIRGGCAAASIPHSRSVCARAAEAAEVAAAVCVWVSVLRCRFCLSLTPAVLVVRVCYLSRRRSWLLVDIWNSAEVSRCEFWINTGKAPCPLLTFSCAGRVRRPNAVLLRRYY